MRIFSLSLVMIAMMSWACNNSTEIVEAQKPRISITVSGLRHLGPGEGHYQVWATFIVFNKASGGESPQHSGGFESLGEFNVVDGDATLYDLDDHPARFRIPEDENAQLLDDVVVTLNTEGSTPTDENPGSIIAGGKFHGDVRTAVADLLPLYEDAFSSDFSNTSGKFTIIAPTSPVDSNSGVWFVELQNGTPTAGLRNLPDLPEGWTYEGWVGFPIVHVVPAKQLFEYQYFSTGKFLRADTSDFDGAGPGKGAGQGFMVPGQDFINPPGPEKPDLTYGRFMITVEPYPDNSPEPFPFTILVSSSASSPVPQGQTLLMSNVATTSLARGRITVIRSGY